MSKFFKGNPAVDARKIQTLIATSKSLAEKGLTDTGLDLQVDVLLDFNAQVRASGNFYLFEVALNLAGFDVECCDSSDAVSGFIGSDTQTPSPG